jgi:hypothetical protein
MEALGRFTIAFPLSFRNLRIRAFPQFGTKIFKYGSGGNGTI